MKTHPTVLNYVLDILTHVVLHFLWIFHIWMCLRVKTLQTRSFTSTSLNFWCRQRRRRCSAGGRFCAWAGCPRHMHHFDRSAGELWCSDLCRSGKTNNFSYSDIFEYAWTCIIIYPYFIVFIFWCIHIQRKSLKPYRIHAYLNVFKIKFFVSYFWPALQSSMTVSDVSCGRTCRVLRAIRSDRAGGLEYRWDSTWRSGLWNAHQVVDGAQNDMCRQNVKNRKRDDIRLEVRFLLDGGLGT
jgi:hypothetical protein